MFLSNLPRTSEAGDIPFSRNVEALEELDVEDDELVSDDGGVSLLRRADRESRGGTTANDLILDL